MSEQLTREQAWPELPLEAWADSCATLHMWTQIVGKIRLRESAPINHGWHSTLYVTARGLTTSPIPHGLRTFQIDFDFIDHVLVIAASDGRIARVALEPQTVASFYRRVMDALHGLEHRRTDLRQAERGARPDSLRPTRCTAPTMRWPSIASGACSSRAIECSSSFAPASSASAARCISSGARSISPSHGSPGGKRPSIPAASPTCPIA